MKRILFAFMAATIILTGCGSEEPSQNPTQQAYIAEQEKQQEQAEESQIVSPMVADPEAALEEIYKDVEVMGIEQPDQQYLDEVLGLLKDVDYKEAYVNRADGKYGVADIYIIKPTSGQEEVVTEKLELIKEARIKEFEDYNIFNSYEIAQEAPIYAHGEYIIMVMIEDSQGAVDIISSYIPQ